MVWENNLMLQGSHWVRGLVKFTAKTVGNTPWEPFGMPSSTLLCIGMTRAAIQAALGLKGRDNFENRYLRPALADVHIELTIPDKPTSSKQKY